MLAAWREHIGTRKWQRSYAVWLTTCRPCLTSAGRQLLRLLVGRCCIGRAFEPRGKPLAPIDVAALRVRTERPLILNEPPMITPTVRFRSGQCTKVAARQLGREPGGREQADRIAMAHREARPENRGVANPTQDGASHEAQTALSAPKLRRQFLFFLGVNRVMIYRYKQFSATALIVAPPSRSGSSSFAAITLRRRGWPHARAHLLVLPASAIGLGVPDPKLCDVRKINTLCMRAVRVVRTCRAGCARPLALASLSRSSNMLTARNTPPRSPPGSAYRRRQRARRDLPAGNRRDRSPRVPA
jgi:hypothetical protein